jgi:hypothetical protein
MRRRRCEAALHRRGAAHAGPLVNQHSLELGDADKHGQRHAMLLRIKPALPEARRVLSAVNIRCSSVRSGVQGHLNDSAQPFCVELQLRDATQTGAYLALYHA